jgi:hypothetical protein
VTRACVLAVGLALVPSLAFAQGRWRDRLDVTVGGGVALGSSLGEVSAELRPNASSQPFALFTTQSRLRRAPLVDGRVAWRLTRRVSVEGRLGYSRPELETSVRADAEDAPPVTIVERIDQFAIDAGIVVQLDAVRLGRLVPVATGGAGYLRQLHEGFTVVEQGHFYYLGGGLARPLFRRDRGVVRRASLRADARLSFIDGGFQVESRTRPHVEITGGLSIGF